MTKRIVLILLVCISCFAKNPLKKKKEAEPVPSPLEQYVREAYKNNASIEAAHTEGSAWSANARFANLAMDLKAYRVDDMVTIVVSETTSAVATGDVKTARQSTAKSAITAAGGITRATGPWANLANTNTQTQLQGQGSTSRGTTLTTNLSARVVHVLPNGYLVVEGSKRVQVNSENQVITVRGVVRPADLDFTNSVTSDRLAQMEIQVNGKGVVADAIRRPFILWRLIMGILPF